MATNTPPSEPQPPKSPKPTIPQEVVDYTNALEDSNREARKLLKDVVGVLDSAGQIPFLSYNLEVVKEIEALGKKVGYGSLMVNASHLWREMLSTDGAEGGEMICSPARGTVHALQKRVNQFLRNIPSPPNEPLYPPLDHLKPPPPVKTITPAPSFPTPEAATPYPSPLFQLGDTGKTLGGETYRVICTDALGKLPVVALVKSTHAKNEYPYAYRADGQWADGVRKAQDLIPPPVPTPPQQPTTTEQPPQPSEKEYGPEIELWGFKPKWLNDDDLCLASSADLCWSATPSPAKHWHFPVIAKIRLLSDHWAYPVIEQGFEPHAGSETAPEDWDGGDVLLRSGDLASLGRENDWVWYDQERNFNYDIIGYKKKPAFKRLTLDEFGILALKDDEDAAALASQESQPSQSDTEIPTPVREYMEQWTPRLYKSLEERNSTISELTTKFESAQAENAALQAELAAARAKYPDLVPDPDRALKDEILAFAKGCGCNHTAVERFFGDTGTGVGLIYAWEKREKTGETK